ncbi:MAG: MoxR family ATPase [Gammaproteobacteria bacterium]
MTDVATFQKQLEESGYVAEPSLAATLLLFTQLRRPLLLEGEAGVGKTEIAKALAGLYRCPLIRLQCYEGLDASAEEKERHIFSEEFLLRRPLLQAISMPEPPVLLVDEIDRADEEFEAYLLEMLSDFQVSIPELGTIRATSIPYVVLTSNATRELSDALRRRCLYYYVDYPSMDKELRIVNRHLPDIDQQLAGQVVGFVHGLRELDLRRNPGVAETLDWVAALLRLEVKRLQDDPLLVAQSLVCLLKTREDRDAVTSEVVDRLVANLP